MVDDPSAALLIRVWREEAGGFRARLLTLRDATAETPAELVTIVVVAAPDDVLDAVRTWLDGFTGEAPDPVDPDDRQG